MNDSLISVRLVGAAEDGGFVDFGDFRHLFNNLAECLQRAESVVTGGERNKIHFRVAQLHAGSGAITLEAVPPRHGPDFREAVVELFKDTVNRLQHGTQTDPRLSPQDLKSFRDLMASPRGTKEVWLDGTKMINRHPANIDEILEGSLPSEGSVKGFLEKINVHNRNECVLFTPLQNDPIFCTFPEELFASVRDALRRNVAVTGTLFYHPDKVFPVRVHAKSIVVMPPDDSLPKLKDLKGLFKDNPNGMSAVDFVRSIRDE